MATLEDVTAKITELETKVATNTTAVDAVIALIKSFPVATPTDPAALQGAVDKVTALEGTVDASTQKLQAVIAENPPA